MEIRPYSPSDWPALQAFIHEHWRAGHPYTHRALFDWQFRGFGRQQAASTVLEHEGRIAGFLGGIPGLYWANGKVRPGVVYDLWVVRPDLRNGALGLLMMKSLEDKFGVCCCLGINPDVVRYYTARGYRHERALHRWVIPLDADGFRELIRSASESVDGELCAAPDLDGAPDIRPLDQPDSRVLQSLYECTVEKVFRLALHRNAEFWDWRYLRSAGFEYQFFGSPADSGIVVARIESIVSPDRPDLDGRPVLRLIECLPADSRTWTGQPDDDHQSLIRGVLAWAANQGCVLADFQHSSDRLDHVLAAAGFTAVGPEAPPAIRAVPDVFQPLRYDKKPINYVWRLAGEAAGEPVIESRDVYFVKSDDGMDRPNVWPLPRTLCEKSRC